MRVTDFLLNRETEQKAAQVVEAPAFSITKVMAIVAPVLTGVVALAIDALKGKVSFSTGQVTTLIVALIAFLAVTSAADVLARSIATSAERSASGRLRMIYFKPPRPGRIPLEVDGVPVGHRDVMVLGLSDADPIEFLIVDQDNPSQVESVPADSVAFKSPA